MALWDRDRHRKLEAHRRAAWQMPTTVRLAGGDDLEALQRLAELDCRTLPPGPHLIAEREGRIEAALSLCTNEVIADPFRRTAELRELLRTYAGDLRTAWEPPPLPRLQRHPLPVET
jgi:hypothetical protein